jgi:folate-binding protein YgfZ
MILTQEVRYLLEAAGVFTLDGLGHNLGQGLGWIRVTGEDRTRWLNGMVTNSIQDLKPGEGNYSFVLNAQGRIQGDLYAFAEADALLLETSRAQVPALMALLDKFIIMDDVELADVSLGRFGIGLAGPASPKILERAGLPVHPAIRRTKTLWDDVEIEVIATYRPIVPRFEIWGDELSINRLRLVLETAAVAEDGGPVTPEAIESLRLLEATPKFGVDIRDRDLPQETAQTRALHFAKGCYLGQEIVERIRSRGAVHRTFTSFRLEGVLPTPGTSLEVDGKAVGELTSAGNGPIEQIGLGFVRREFIERQSEILYAGGRAYPLAPSAIAKAS